MTLQRRQILTASMLAWATPWSAFAASATSRQDELVFDGVRLIDGSGGAPQNDMRVLVANGRIAAIGSMQNVGIPHGAQRIAVPQATLLPGLISNHVHLGLYDGLVSGAAAHTPVNILGQLRLYQRYGVTTVAAMGVNTPQVYPMQALVQSGAVTGADFVVAEGGIGTPDGAPPIDMDPSPVVRPINAQQARQAVQDATSRGANYIKLWFDDFQGQQLTKMDPEVYRAAIDETHRQGKRAFVHIYYLEDAKQLLRAGADVLVHGVRDQPIDGEFVTLMKRNNAWYVPALTVEEAFFLFAEQPELLEQPFLRNALHADLRQQFATPQWQQAQLANPALQEWKSRLTQSQRNAKSAVEQGVNVSFGTDSGAMPLRVPGFAEHRELELLVQAGLTPLQALHTATARAAQALELADRGTIAQGQRADLLLVSGNPATNILDTRNIVGVWQAGSRVV
ncbi:amidohydrolase family protein [Lampropedia aestuarii]|uniref:Amidohydrolase family protein n=1 Tax=Lampropedia aestuarii TaxID=2562762 RepID=A0A4S5BJE1_9BURK|nr:amidohydrolase family protein [Lampropedia aestuarii]THJ32450.1 amidohydrolase family protein [Lampropedia aestuarii]